MSSAADPVFERVRSWVQEAAPESISALVGAGISTDSGIPDFRGPNGVWTRNPSAERMFTLQHYVEDPAVRRLAWQNRRDHPAWTAVPNEGHRALVALERDGRLRAVVTQNIDELHQRAGQSPERVIEIHGTVFAAECLGCGRRIPMREALDRVDAGEPDPACTGCGGILKSATISFGQSLRPEVLSAATDAARRCTLFLAIGSSLQVQPAAALCEVASRYGARLVIINAEPTPYDGLADAVLRRQIGDVLPQLVLDRLGVVTSRVALVQTATLRLAGGQDDAAPGAAVTVALCGHWEHDGPCRWPHHTSHRRPDGDGSDRIEVRVVAVTEASEAAALRASVEAALRTGRLEGPNGPVSWEVVATAPGDLIGEEVALADRLGRE